MYTWALSTEVLIYEKLQEYNCDQVATMYYIYPGNYVCQYV